MTTSEAGHIPGAAPQPTDELNVFGAIVRLVERHRGDEVAALNLSLGAHDCPDSGTFLMTMRIALEHWRANFDTEIFAAGGNSVCEQKVYPAAWSDLGIRAVGAATNGGVPIVWRDGNDVLPAPSRNWITDWAPGHEVLGLSGRSTEDVIQWSGSSFACAVATAAYVSAVRSTTVGTETWWTDQSVDYGNIPELLI